MMKGYDKQEALAFILQRIRPQDHPELADRLEDLIGRAIDADMAYMHASGVLDEAYYEDDEAIEYIVEHLAEENRMDPEKAVNLASLVDDYLDYQQEYLEYKGLVDWE